MNTIKQHHSMNQIIIDSLFGAFPSGMIDNEEYFLLQLYWERENNQEEIWNEYSEKGVFYDQICNGI